MRKGPRPASLDPPCEQTHSQMIKISIRLFSRQQVGKLLNSIQGHAFFFKKKYKKRKRKRKRKGGTGEGFQGSAWRWRQGALALFEDSHLDVHLVSSISAFR